MLRTARVKIVDKTQTSNNHRTKSIGPSVMLFPPHMVVINSLYRGRLLTASCVLGCWLTLAVRICSACSRDGGEKNTYERNALLPSPFSSQPTTIIACDDSCKATSSAPRS